MTRILLAEDDRAYREMLADALEIAGFQVVAAASGSEALAIADAFDLLIADVVMPGMSGTELAERLCSLRPGLPVIFMSGYSEDELRASGPLPLHAGLLRKPFDLDELTRQVRAALGGNPGGGETQDHAQA